MALPYSYILFKGGFRTQWHWVGGLMACGCLTDEVSAAGAPLCLFFHLSLCLGQEQGYLPLLICPHFCPCVAAVTLSSVAERFLWSVWAVFPRLSDGVHLPCAVLTSQCSFSVNFCFPFIPMDTPGASAAGPSPPNVSSARLLAGWLSDLSGGQGTALSTLRCSLPSLSLPRAWEAGSWVPTRCLLLLSLRTLFLLLHLGALPFAVEYRTNLLSLFASPFKNLHISYPKSVLWP